MLEIEQRFEPPLRDLRLVRRVSGVPAGVFQNVPLNHGRGNAVVIAGADKRAGDPVSICNSAQLRERFSFRLRLWQIELAIQPDISRNGRID